MLPKTQTQDNQPGQQQRNPQGQPRQPIEPLGQRRSGVVAVQHQIVEIGGRKVNVLQWAIREAMPVAKRGIQ